MQHPPCSAAYPAWWRRSAPDATKDRLIVTLSHHVRVGDALAARDVFSRICTEPANADAHDRELMKGSSWSVKRSVLNEKTRRSLRTTD